MDVVGRDAETRQLIGWLTEASGTGPGAVRVTAIGGMAGVGTSALAVHVAWRVSDRFFDGHLFAQLRGTSRRPVSPHDVLAVFLRQLGIASGAVPADPGERSALFRTLAADRRLLLVLDDARDAAQVAPLVPGGAGCAVVVTHRRQLAGLPGCRHVELDPLSAEASRRMLDRLVGRARLAAEPGATGALVAACAGLPLALRVVAERLVARPDWRIEDLARRFRPRSRHSGAPSGTVLDELGTDGFSVRAGFEAGYVALARPLVGPGRTGAGSASPVPTPAQRAFRLLGEWNGVEIASTEAASLLALPLEEAERLLENLADVRLVRSWRPGRYLLHPLVKEFAGELRAVGPASPPRPVAVGEETR
ncbi:MAG: hypothetical protein HOW97_08395 [Catenulispora sp.]|nr:hypothetical protein [Catenulispora sp.]